MTLLGFSLDLLACAFTRRIPGQLGQRPRGMGDLNGLCDVTAPTALDGPNYMYEQPGCQGFLEGGNWALAAYQLNLGGRNEWPL